MSATLSATLMQLGVNRGFVELDGARYEFTVANYQPPQIRLDRSTSYLRGNQPVQPTPHQGSRQLIVEVTRSDDSVYNAVATFYAVQPLALGEVAGFTPQHDTRTVAS